jgi:putative inorganic carbon (hco3(-)) transporter
LSNILAAFLGIYAFFAVGAFFFAPYGVWGFVFESNFHPPLWWWGKPAAALGERWSFFIGAIMLVTAGLHWSRFSDTKVLSNAKTWLLLLFVANSFLISRTWATIPDDAWEESVDFLKWLLFFLVMVKTHSNRAWLPVVLYIYILSAIKMGWDETWYPHKGRLEKVGTATTFEANFLAAHIVTLLPIAGAFVACSDVNRKLRWTIALGLPFMFNLFAAASSRGAMVALGAVGIVSLLITKGQVRRYIIVGIALGSLVAMRLLNDQFWGRFDTIKDYEEDGSAMGRVYAWKAAWVLIQQNPLGYGAEAFDKALGEPLMPLDFHTTHNMFFEIFVAYGAQGVVLFFGAILISMYQCWRIQRLNWVNNSDVQPRAVWESTGVLLGFVAMVVSTIFLNRIRWELWWVMMGYATCLQNTYGNMRSGNSDTASDGHSVEEESSIEQINSQPERPGKSVLTSN